MSDREKLIELLKHDPCPSIYLCNGACGYDVTKPCFAERYADYLIANDVFIREKGEWRFFKESNSIFGECSKCGHVTSGVNAALSSFCPNCGADLN